MKKTRLFTGLVCALILSACSKTENSPIASGAEDSEANVAMQAALEKLSPSDQDLATRYLARQRVAEALGRDLWPSDEPFPSATTLAQAIDAQKAMDAAEVERKARQPKR